MNIANNPKIKIEYLPINQLKLCEYNPRKISEKDFNDLIKSLSKFGTVDPLIINSDKQRYGTVVGGNQRLLALKKLGYSEIPVVKINIPDINLEKELNIRLNRNQGEFEWKLLADFDEEFLSEIGFSSEELDTIFDVDPTPEIFDLERELKKLQIDKIQIKKGDI